MTNQLPRLFAVHREDDVHGISGKGIVMYGVEFPDGQAASRWVGNRRIGSGAITVWRSMVELMSVHGHGTKTRLVWLTALPLAEVLDTAPVLARYRDYERAKQAAGTTGFAYLELALVALADVPTVVLRYQQLLAAHQKLVDQHADLRAEADAMQAHLEAAAELDTEAAL